MTRDELVEKVAEALYAERYEVEIAFGAMPEWSALAGDDSERVHAVHMATAALRLVVEECARVADQYPSRDPAEDGNGYWAAEEIARTIRALLPADSALSQPKTGE